MESDDRSVAGEQQVRTGETWMESPTTGNIYRVTRWKPLGDGRAVALKKEFVKPGDQPADPECPTYNPDDHDPDELLHNGGDG